MVDLFNLFIRCKCIGNRPSRLQRQYTLCPLRGNYEFRCKDSRQRRKNEREKEDWTRQSSQTSHGEDRVKGRRRWSPVWKEGVDL